MTEQKEHSSNQSIHEPTAVFNLPEGRIRVYMGTASGALIIPRSIDEDDPYRPIRGGPNSDEMVEPIVK